MCLRMPQSLHQLKLKEEYVHDKDEVGSLDKDSYIWEGGDIFDGLHGHDHHLLNIDVLYLNYRLFIHIIPCMKASENSVYLYWPLILYVWDTRGMLNAFHIMYKSALLS